MQYQIDFDNPMPQVEAPKPDALILEMSKGKTFGEFLRDFDKSLDVDKPVWLTEQGVWKVKTFAEYPKGISIHGKGAALIKAEKLWRILLRSHAPKPSFEICSAAWTTGEPRLNKLIKGLGNEYVKIVINGKVEVKTGKFTATIPTEKE